MIPKGKHTDWLWPFSLIPRGFNAVESLRHPRLLAESKGEAASTNLDIPHPNNWVLTYSCYGLYFALTTKHLWHFRIGTFRYDYVDSYYTFPTFTIKRLKNA